MDSRAESCFACVVCKFERFDDRVHEDSHCNNSGNIVSNLVVVHLNFINIDQERDQASNGFASRLVKMVILEIKFHPTMLLVKIMFL
jgi:hypothetical protein